MEKLKKGISNLINLNTFLLSKLVPKKKKRWVIGSWFGERFTDNSMWLYYHVAEKRKDIELIWITKNDDVLKKITSQGGKCELYNTYKAIWYVLSAEVVFVTQSHLDLCSFNIIGGAFKIQLWHGVALKKIGQDAIDINKNIMVKVNRLIVNTWNSYDVYIAPSDEYKSKVITAFNTTEDKIIKVGQPRNDVLFNYSDGWKKCFRDKIEQKYGVSIDGKKIITYMPTFRDKKGKSYSFVNLDKNNKIKIENILKDNNCIIIEKGHFVDSYWRNDGEDKIQSNIIQIKDIDTQDLLANTDILITDYSSCYFDFLILDRPIIHFAYDYEYYENKDRGMYYKLEYAAGGAICKSLEEVYSKVEQYLENNELDSKLRRNTRAKFITYENGKACDEIVKYVYEKIYS